MRAAVRVLLHRDGERSVRATYSYLRRSGEGCDRKKRHSEEQRHAGHSHRSRPWTQVSRSVPSRACLCEADGTSLMLHRLARRILRPRRRQAPDLAQDPVPKEGEKQARHRSPTRTNLPRPIPSILEVGAYAPSSAATAALPLEVLILILDLLPPFGRLRVCALVCKRWRCAVAHTVHTITLGQHAPPLQAICAVFPSLTKLRLRIDALCRDPLVLPVALRSIKFVEQAEGSLRKPELPLPATLTRLTLHPFGALLPLLPWLTQLRTSLTKLRARLPFSEKADTHWSTFLCEWHFPALTNLRIGFNRLHKDHVVTFLERHSSQLQSLYLLADEEVLLSRPLSSLPAIRRLRFNYIHPQDIGALVEASPLLNELDIEYHQGLEADLLPLWSVPRVQATLCSLVCGSVPHRIDLLMACTRLKHPPFELIQPVLADRQHAATLLTRLVSVPLQNLQPFIDAASGLCLSHLQMLVVNVSLSYNPSQHQRLQLPHLTRLEATAYDGHMDDAIRLDLALCIAQVRFLVESAPRLRSFSLSVDLARLTTSGVEGMVQFVRDLAARGVEEVDLSDTHVASPLLKSVCRSFPWMLVHIGPARGSRSSGYSDREAPHSPSGAWLLSYE